MSPYPERVTMVPMWMRGTVVVGGVLSFLWRRQARVRRALGFALVCLGCVITFKGVSHLHDPVLVVRDRFYLVPEQPGFAGLGFGGIVVICGICADRVVWVK
jgi:hypothetical protein